jgi:hypothetical protein
MHPARLENIGARRPKKEARPKGPGKPLRVAAQYSQKMPKNNGLFAVWLADFGAQLPFSGDG